MALTSAQANIVLGSRANAQQEILGIPAGPSGEDPGILCLESTDATGATFGRVYLWADSGNNLRFGTTVPTDENADGAIVASSVGSGAASSTLNNLGTTAVNAHILPATSASKNLGAAALYWNSAYLTTLYLTSTCYVTASSAVATLVGSITLTDGDIVITEGKITIDSTASDLNYIKRNQTTTTGPLLELETTHTSDDYPALLVDHNATGAIDAVQITSDATGNALSIATTAATGVGILLTGPASQTTSLLKLTSANVNASNVGTIHVVNTGNLANANATDLYMSHSGTIATSSLGGVARFLDASAASTGSYAVQIASTNNRGLNVSVGQSLFADGLSTKCAVDNVHDTTPTAASLITAFGAAATHTAGFIGTVNDAGGGVNFYIVCSDAASYFFLKLTLAT